MRRVTAGFPDNQSVGTSTSNSAGTIVTANASANTKGGWNQLIASSPFDASGFWVLAAALNGSTADNDNYVIDIGIGAALSEVAIAQNLAKAAGGTLCLFIPLEIPAGQRISARCQCDFGGGPIQVAVRLVACAPNIVYPLALGEQLFDTIDLTGSLPKLINAPAVANTKSAWTQLVASTSRVCRKLIVGAGYEANNTSPAAAPEHLYDIGIGGAGSEVVLIPDLYQAIPMATRPGYSSFFYDLDVDIPAGSRLSVRHQSPGTTADYQLRIAMYGFG